MAVETSDMTEGTFIVDMQHQYFLEATWDMDGYVARDMIIS